MGNTLVIHGVLMTNEKESLVIKVTMRKKDLLRFKQKLKNDGYVNPAEWLREQIRNYIKGIEQEVTA